MSDPKEPTMPDHFHLPNYPQAGEVLSRPDGTVLHVDEVVIKANRSLSTSVHGTELSPFEMAEYWKLAARKAGDRVIELEEKNRRQEGTLKEMMGHGNEIKEKLGLAIYNPHESVIERIGVLQNSVNVLQSEQRRLTIAKNHLFDENAHLLDKVRRLEEDLKEAKDTLAIFRTYNQHTKCALCGEDKPTPLRRDDMGGYVCLACVEKKLDQVQPALDENKKKLSEFKETITRIFDIILPRGSMVSNAGPINVVDAVRSLNDDLIRTKGQFAGAQSELNTLTHRLNVEQQNLHAYKVLLGKIRTALNIDAISTPELDAIEKLRLAAQQAGVEEEVVKLYRRLRPRLDKLCTLLGLVKDGKPFDDGSSLETEVEFLVEQNLKAKVRDGHAEPKNDHEERLKRLEDAVYRRVSPINATEGSST
jgi:transposase